MAISKIPSKESNETVVTKHIDSDKISIYKIRELTGPPPKMIVPFNRVKTYELRRNEMFKYLPDTCYGKA